MVVCEADKLGLSQLYQLRGRIGRSDKLSYAYLLYDSKKVLTEDSIKRLEAIKEFTELGSGFKIAMRDLEIRGAGNIFGKEQHGHIAKVGYDMFVKLLDEQVKEIKGQKVVTKNDVKLEIALSAFISEDYVADSEKRIEFYTKISEINSQAEMNDILIALEDGYGQVPKEVKNLCLVALLKNLAGNFEIEKIKIDKENNEMILKKTENIIDERLSKALTNSEKLTFDSKIKIKFAPNLSIIEKINSMIEFLQRALDLKVN